MDLGTDCNTVAIRFEVEMDLTYNPFKGKTVHQFADMVSDDLTDALLELRPDVKEVYTKLKSITENIDGVNCADG